MKRNGQRGQAIAETALLAGVMFLVAMLGLTAVPLHRAHTAAVSAVYACTQFITQYPNQPDKAAQKGYEEAHRTLSGGWNALAGASFHLTAFPPQKAGEAGTCKVTYSVKLLFDPFGVGRHTRTITLIGRSERWKAEWKR